MLAVFKVKRNDKVEEVQMNVKVRKDSRVFQVIYDSIEQLLKSMGLEAKNIIDLKAYRNSNQGYLSSYFEEEGNFKEEMTSHNSMVSPAKLTESKDNGYTEILVVNEKGEDETIYVKVDAYRKGFIIGLGNEDIDFMGRRYDSYINNLTSGSRRFRLKSSSKDYAKVFNTPKQLMDWITNKRDLLVHVTRTEGYDLSVEYASTKAESLFNPSLGNNKKNLELAYALIDAINEAAQEEDKSKRKVITGETPKEEALIRMKELSLWDQVIKNFKNEDKVYISDVGGIFFDLDSDETAVEMVKNIKAGGGLPYLIIKSGEMYTCLYVSKYKSEWAGERFDRKNGYIFAAASFAGDVPYDLGTVGVKLTLAGGLERTF